MLTCQGTGGNCSMDALSQGVLVGVERATDDAFVGRILPVKPLEVISIKRQDGASVQRRPNQDTRVVATSFASFLHGQHVVPQSAQAFNDSVIEILVGV